MNFERQKLGLPHDQHIVIQIQSFKNYFPAHLYTKFLLSCSLMCHYFIGPNLEEVQKHAFQGKNGNPFEPWLDIQYPIDW